MSAMIGADLDLRPPPGWTSRDVTVVTSLRRGTEIL
jgi:hypothetical protein